MLVVHAPALGERGREGKQSCTPQPVLSLKLRQSWSHTAVIPALGRWGREDQEFKVERSHRARWGQPKLSETLSKTKQHFFKSKMETMTHFLIFSILFSIENVFG